MKMVKSLLLVSAAGLVAASGAQAADLPVKAKPVEYVKVCSLYGAGFWYVPGSDICMKIGGYIRFQESFGATGITAGPFSTAGALNNRQVSADQSYRSRAILTWDTRQQTSYGTLRTYLILGATSDNGAAAGIYANRAFIQIAGFTMGKASSYFDFISSAAVAYNAGHLYTPDTGDGGAIVAAYTAQLGNGVSATISAEQARRKGIDHLRAATMIGSTVATTGVFTAAATLTPGGALGANEGGTNLLQDIVGNLRIDQAWGSAQVAVAAHNAGASYFGSGTGSATLTEQNGHPGTKWGWAVSPGLRLNTPMIGPGDYFQASFTYTKGALTYASNTPTTMVVANGTSVGSLIMNDGGFSGTSAAPGVFELTTAWSMFASYEHFWTPSLRTSMYGSYINISRSDALNDAMCASGQYNLSTVAGTIGTAATVASTRATGCNLDASAWNIGSRSQWNVTKDLYVGLDVVYHKLNTATFNSAGSATLTNSSAAGKASSGSYTTGNQEAVAATWRIHRDIVP